MAEPATMPAPATLPLFDLVQRYTDVLIAIEEAEGELTPELVAQLDALEPQLERKCEAIAVVHAMLTEDGEACERLAKPYLDRAKRKKRQAETLKERLKGALELLDVRKVVTPTVTVALQANPPRVELTVPEAALPDDAVVVTRSPDTSGIKTRLKAGEQLDYAQLVSGGDHLRFRR